MMIQFHFHMPLNCDNIDKWLDAMKDEFKSMEHNDVWNIMVKGARELGINGSLRLSTTPIATLNVRRPILLLKILLRKMALIIRKHSHQFQERFFHDYHDTGRSL